MCTSIWTLGHCKECVKFVHYKQRPTLLERFFCKKILEVFDGVEVRVLRVFHSKLIQASLHFALACSFIGTGEKKNVPKNIASE